jgi:hypothetical protein
MEWKRGRRRRGLGTSKSLCFFAFLTFGIRSAEAAQSDAEIARALIGSWIVPHDSSDATEENTRSVEEFHSDGTYTVYVYADAACVTLVAKIKIGWTLKGGVLLSRTPDGQTLRDEVVNIGPKTMTLHSLDDGSTYTRVRATTCSLSQS